MKPLPPPALKSDSQTASILGLPVHLLSKDQARHAAEELIASGRVARIVTANALLVLEAGANPSLLELCLSADLVLSDSVGISWAAWRLGMPIPTRYPGIDLAFDLTFAAEQKRASVFLLGGRPGIAERAAGFLKTARPGLRIAGTRDGFFEAKDDESVIEEVRKSGAGLVLVALGMPRQDVWIHRNRARLPGALYVGVGGTFDVWAGAVKRAPRWFSRTGLEWLYRVVQEPWRWRRIARLPLFLLRVATASK